MEPSVILMFWHVFENTNSKIVFKEVSEYVVLVSEYWIIQASFIVGSWPSLEQTFENVILVWAWPTQAQQSHPYVLCD